MQRTARVRQGPKGGSHFKVCWAGKLVIGDHVTGFFDQRGGRRASGLIIGEDRCALSGGSKCTEERYVQATSNPVSAVNHL